MPNKLPSPSDYTPDFVLVDHDDEEPNLATGSVLTRVAARGDDGNRESIDALLAQYLVDGPASGAAFPSDPADAAGRSEPSETPPDPRPRGPRRGG